MPHKKKQSKGRSRAGDRPQPDQLAAIDRTLREGRPEDALRRVEKLLVHFPRTSGLHARRVEILNDAGREFEAVLAAHDWTEACPNSFAAWDAAAEHFAQSDRAALTDRARRHRNELALHQPLLPLLTEAMWQELAASPYGKPVTHDDVCHSELGLLLMRAGRWGDAARLLHGSQYPCNQNNGALAHFHMGEIDRALELFRAAFAQEPRNVFALAWAARLELFLGNEAGLSAATNALRDALPERADDALSQLAALLLIGEEGGAALARAHYFRRQAWWDVANVETRAQLRHTAAVAAIRSGAVDEAGELWDEAVDLNADDTTAHEQLEDLKKPECERQGPWLLPLWELFPRTWLDELRLMRKQDKPDFDARLADLGASVSLRYLERAYDVGNPATLFFVRGLLLVRAEPRDQEAISALHRCVASHRGVYADRLEISSTLVNRGLAREDQEFMVWDGSELRAIAVKRQKLYREPRACDLSNHQLERMSSALQLARKRYYHEAREVLDRLVTEAPDQPMLLTNLAAVHEAEGNHVVMEQLLRRAHEIDPDYVFARCNLARFYLGRGELEAAEELLRGVDLRSEMHVLEYISLNGTEALLYAARGRRSLAENLLRGLAAVAESQDEKARVAQLSATAERLLEQPIAAGLT